MGAPTLHQAIVESVAQHILSGEIQPGEVLTLTWIQEEYGVSRTVARETARVLESVGLLEARRKVGLVVRPQSEWSALHPRMVRWMMQGGGHLAELRALTELRLAVEPVAASAAATLATSEQREELKALARRLYQLADRADSQDFLEADIRFHALLLEASGNPIFVSLKGALAETLRGRVAWGLMPREAALMAITGHAHVAWLVAGGDREAAFHATVAMLGGLRRELGQ
ncbi:FCD domain-containing protein [Brooklawnia propionicigenes]|jgi:DNA-binding FadR family transcriptional regulator|uniref:FCD domain-containing protein n=1 Tax=Brooklawnia propionicigenes TaxID=3041175 RepID=A0AAN0K632_9ACTN|nr:FCD domain-containing protein [Brooklawnia sp. SH051]BEH01323.1 FCD domain-containing protein [Brooklawnia sp. SH051]